jgi:hypothetical protein
MVTFTNAVVAFMSICIQWHQFHASASPMRLTSLSYDRGTWASLRIHHLSLSIRSSMTLLNI